MEAQPQMGPDEPSDLAGAVNAFVDAWRVRALWSVRPDWYPATDAERWQALDTIQQHCDREAFARAARLKAWLSRRSSDASAAP